MNYLLLKVLFAVFALGVPRPAYAQVIIANSGIKATEVTKADLRDIFTGGSSTLAGTQVSPVLLKSGPVTDAFLATYIGKSDTAFHAGWRSLVFSGQATMPKSVDSDAAVIDYVAHNAGAIGYIGKAAPHEGVKILTTP